MGGRTSQPLQHTQDARIADNRHLRGYVEVAVPSAGPSAVQCRQRPRLHAPRFLLTARRPLAHSCFLPLAQPYHTAKWNGRVAPLRCLLLRCRSCWLEPWAPALPLQQLAKSTRWCWSCCRIRSGLGCLACEVGAETGRLSLFSDTVPSRQAIACQQVERHCQPEPPARLQ